MNREAFEAEYSKCDFGIEGHNFKKNPDGSYESQQTYTAFHWFKKGAAIASQAQQKTLKVSENWREPLSADAMQRLKNLGVMDKPLPPAPEGGE